MNKKTRRGNTFFVSGGNHINSLDRRDLLQLAIVLTLAAATRIYKLEFASLWLDEVTTMEVANYPLSTLWVTAYDPTPPLYYTIIHWVLNFGHSEFLLRLPSVAFGVLTVGVVYMATRRVAGPLAAFAASLVLALSFHNIEYSQEARAYSLLGLCLSISFYGIIGLCMRWQNSSSGFTLAAFIKSGGGLYALGLIGALYTHNTAVFYWFGVQFFFLAWWFHPFAFSRSCLASWFTINSVVVLLWMPWLFASLEVMEKGSFSWLQQYDRETAFIIWRKVHGMRSTLIGQPYVDFFILIFGVIGLYGLRRRFVMVWLFLGLLVSSSLLIWLYGFFASPVYMLRTILWGSLFSAVLVGIGVSALPTRLGYIVTLLIFLWGSGGVFNYYENNRAENESWRSAASLIKEMQRPNDIFLFRSHYIAPPFFYYFGEYSPGGGILGWNCSKGHALSGQIKRSGHIPGVTWTDSDFGADNQVAKSPGASLWVIEAHCRPKSWEKADAVFFPNWVLKKTYKFKGVYVHRMVPMGNK